MTPMVALLLVQGSVAPPTSVTVPMILEGNAPMVEVQFPTLKGGVRKARFLVDSGGGAFILCSKLIADVGAKASGPAEKEDGESYVNLEPVTAKLGKMPLNFEGVPILGKPDSEWLLTRNHAEGLIPARMLRHYCVIFDYVKRTFTLDSSGTRKHIGTPIPTPISRRTGYPRLEFVVDNKTYGALLDTGASFTMMSRKVLDTWAAQNPTWPNSTGATGFANMFGGPMEKDLLLLRVPSLKLGDADIKSAVACSRPEGTFEKWMSRMMTQPIVGSIAGNVLLDFRVEIDFANGVTYFRRDRVSSDADQNSVGLVMTVGKSGDLVVSGLSSSAADDVKSSVNVGDALVAVNGVNQTGRPLAQVAESLHGGVGRTKRLRLRRGDKTLDVVVTVKRLL